MTILDAPSDRDFYPEPPCTCIRLDVDLYDAAGCERCDPSSEYNQRQRDEPEPEPIERAWDADSEICPF